MSEFLGYRCSLCDQEYGPDEVIYVCAKDGGNLDVVIDYASLKGTVLPGGLAKSRYASIWRYLPLLPVSDPGHSGTPLWSVGWTPMYSAASLAGKLGLQHLWIKDDGRNPTASFKDRASAVVVARAEAIGAEVVVTASTGNAGAALAGMAAAVNMPAVILAPRSAPRAKVAQLLVFGAQVVLVDGTYDEAFDLTIEAAKTFGWYCRNTGYNPFTAEGKKTAAFEICEQLTDQVGTKAEDPEVWASPDAVFVSVGDGNIISGLHKGFRELASLGWIRRIPRLFGVQAKGSAAVYQAFRSGNEKIQPVRADTIADSISVDLPRDGVRAYRAATQTGGAYVAVSDGSILAAVQELGEMAAIFAEPAGAAAYAGLGAAVEQGLVGRDEHIVVLNTGSGLKDVEAAMTAAGEAKVIEPTLSALKQAMA